MAEKEINDGGAAYPCLGSGLTPIRRNEGMSLRDAFAMAALQGLLANPQIQLTYEEFTTESLKHADIMLEARKKK